MRKALLICQNLDGTKGQLILEKNPKNQRKIWQISALEYKKWSNQQTKGTFL